MKANYVQRLRFVFRKEGPARWISHLDLARTLERALNRAQMPVSYTQGFNRRPRLAMAAPLPLGYTSRYELADIWLTETMDPDAARAQMMSKMAPGIVVETAYEVPIAAPSLQASTLSATYVATLRPPQDAAALRQQVDAMHTAESIERIRETGKNRKAYDLRPLIHDLSLAETAAGTLQLTMRLSMTPTENGRPDELLLELGLDPLDHLIERTHIELAETTAPA
ncbi:MAG: TIGR03936 family radical SAM-associated protein [Anaerolineales bacterium]|nr:TIGR03936 family radical SAM-associated protein [Anaerolineales bacterium]